MINYNLEDEKNLEFYNIGNDELLNGERVFIDVNEKSVVVFNIAGKYFAISDVCSHDEGPVGDGLIDGYHIVCPRHGAEFDVRSGKAMTMPAVRDIPAFPIKVIDGNIFIGIPKE